jgi:hypothetical protein
MSQPDNADTSGLSEDILKMVEDIINEVFSEETDDEQQGTD